MIFGINRTPLDDLMVSSYRFFLTGSRFFNQYVQEEFPKNTDYDFYTQDSPEVREFLEQEGFIVRNDRYASDLRVYECNTAKIKVHVILVPDLNQMHTLHHLLMAANIMHLLPKEARERVFTAFLGRVK